MSQPGLVADFLAEAAAADPPALAEMLGTSLDGLSSPEAARRRERYGLNTISLESRSIGKIIRGQVSGINVLLAVAGILTLATGDLIDGVIILVLIAINVGLSIFQEYRAERALGALRALLPFRTRARRDGVETPLPSIALVPGDLIALEIGDLVPADCRVMEANALKVNQATLTGESEPAAKDPAPVTSSRPSEWTNLVLADIIQRLPPPRSPDAYQWWRASRPALIARSNKATTR